MTTTPALPERFVDDFKTLAINLARDATHNEDPERRQASACWLGLMKYDDERATRHTAPRSPGNEVLNQVATARLPVIDAFIDTADAEQLRHVLEGMVYGLDNDPPDPGPEYLSTPYTISLFADLVADIAQQHDAALRQRAGRRVGTLKHDIEHGLRDWDRSTAEHQYLEVEATAIDDFIAIANASELRDIIHGFTTATRN